MSQGKARIFLSYARGDDEAFVRRLHADLVAARFDVWFDRVSMPSRELSFYQEIRDAIAASDRVLLVVGPRAVVSEYVTQEWQAALELCKCVNPIVRLDGAGHAGERVDGYGLIPEELKLVHAEDFRRDAEYAELLANLVRQLSDAVPPLGKLIAVPSLPVHYRAQPDRLKQLREAILVDLRSPVVVTGAAAKVGVQGMGGIGKSVLAAALARDQQVRLAFPDGICWVDVGQQPNVVELQRRLASLLGDPALFDNVYAGKQVLHDLLANRQVLIVLDNVWARKDADAFDVLGPRCKLMLTTRDAGLVTSLAGTGYQVQLPTEAEAMALLSTAAGVEIGALPLEARGVAGECGKLPLALALCGGMARAGTSWRDVLDALREHDLEFPSDAHSAEEQHRSIWRAIEVSVSVLSEDQRKRFAELGVFLSGVKVPEAAVVTLWTHTGGLSERAARKLLVEFKQRSLIQLERIASEGGVAESGSGAPALVGLHDLMYDFAVRSGLSLCGTANEQHRVLTEAYWGKCSDGWASGPNDGYFLQHLADHLIGAGRGGEFVDLVFDLRWLEAKNRGGLTFALPGDLVAAAKVAGGDDARRRLLPLIEEAIRRDIHFIARHAQDYPQGLFQCLWNSCWWYDCAEAASHYDPPSDGWGPHGAPWDRVGPKLCELLERWRGSKEQAVPGFAWVRAVRPPPVQLGGNQRLVLSGHEEGVRSAAFSLDGARVVTASWDKTARVWDAATGEPIAILRGHEMCVRAAAFSPDGMKVVTASWDKTARVWDAATGAPIAILRGHRDHVDSAAFSPDGMQVVTGSRDKTARVWDAATGAQIAGFGLHENAVNSAAISSDGTRVVTASEDKTARVWNAATAAQAALLLGHEGGVWSAAFSSDGMRVVTACADNTARVWDAATGAPIAILRGHEARVRSAAFSPDGTRVVTASGDKTARVWEATTRAPAGLLHGHKAGVPQSPAFSTDGSRVVTASFDKTALVWDVLTGVPVAVLRGHEDRLFFAAFNPDGTRVFTASYDHTFRVWDAANGECLEIFRDKFTFPAIAAVPKTHTWRALAGSVNTRIERQADGDEVGWYAASLDLIATHPDGRTWAGLVRHQNHLHLFLLEGQPAP